MSEQLSLGIDQARTDGIALVMGNTPSDWSRSFDDHVRAIPKGTQFSIYDVLAVVGRPEDVHPSAIGARMRVVSHSDRMVRQMQPQAQPPR